MRVKISHRLALLGAIGVVAMTAGAAHSAAPAYAGPASGPIASGFHEVALQGFGDRANSWPWSMEFFNNRLYVGTNRNYDCTMDAMIVNAIGILSLYPPNGPNVSCPTPLSALPPTVGGQIWSLDLSAPQPYTQSDWQMVYQSPLTVPITVPGNVASMGPRDMAFRGMSVFDDGDPAGPALYVSGVGVKPISKNSVPPPSLLRTTSGLTGTFTPVPADPGTVMGDINTLSTLPNSGGVGGCCLRGETSMTDTTGANHFLALVGTVQGAGAVFAATQPQGGDNNFVQLTPPSLPVFEMAPFNGHLYLGVQSTDRGYSVMWTDCLTPPPGQSWCPASAFHKVVPYGGGLGSSSGNFTVTSMQVFTTTETITNTDGTTSTIAVPHLYVGTDGSPYQKPTEIVRVNPDNSWDLVVGNPRMVNGVLMQPLSGLPQGFGWYFNWHMWRMTVYAGVLYVGTFDASTEYLTPQQQQQYAPYVGFDLWASTDGVHFQPVTLNGFGDRFTYGARSLKGTPNDGLFVGGANHFYGLRIFQGTPTSSSFKQAPGDLQVSTIDHAGTVALAWDAPSNATLFHVYRATIAPQAAPPQPALRDDPESLGTVGHLPRTIWMPGPYVEIGTSTAASYVDRTAQAGAHYSYYVVAQEASGALSMPSSVGMAPSLAPAATFRAVGALLAGQVARGALSRTQGAAAATELWRAYLRLGRGDVPGSLSALAAFQQQAVAGAQTPLDAENLTQLLAQLRTRTALVSAHVLTASQLW